MNKQKLIEVLEKASLLFLAMAYAYFWASARFPQQPESLSESTKLTLTLGAFTTALTLILIWKFLTVGNLADKVGNLADKLVNSERLAQHELREISTALIMMEPLFALRLERGWGQERMGSKRGWGQERMGSGLDLCPGRNRKHVSAPFTMKPISLGH